MQSIEVPVSDGLASLLPGCDFADAYAIEIDEPAADARAAAERAFASMPNVVRQLLAVRDCVVRPFGLKSTSDAKRAVGVNFIGLFPLISETPERIVLGFDDRHLDFRVIIDVAALDNGRQRVTASTLVKRHNLFGQVYLAAVLPFHKMIVPSMLGHVAA